MSQHIPVALLPCDESVLPHAKSWAVAWTVAHGEHSLQDYFATLKVPCFLPRVFKRCVYKSGVKSWSLPLFPGYVFFDPTAIERHRVFESRKVADILLPSNPLELQHELTQIAFAIVKDSGLRESRFGRPGRPVYVARGPMKGLYGELVRLKSECRLILRVGFLGKAVELAIDDAYVEPVL